VATVSGVWGQILWVTNMRELLAADVALHQNTCEGDLRCRVKSEALSRAEGARSVVPASKDNCEPASDAVVTTSRPSAIPAPPTTGIDDEFVWNEGLQPAKNYSARA
jgi:hypothetical protein